MYAIGRNLCTRHASSAAGPKRHSGHASWPAFRRKCGAVKKQAYSPTAAASCLSLVPPRQQNGCLEAEDAEGENGGWTIKLIIFVGGTNGSVHAQTLNDNLKKLQVIESKRNAIRKGLVYELLNAQDTVLCSYFAQRTGEQNEWQNQCGAAEEVFQGLGNFKWGMQEDNKPEDEQRLRLALRDDVVYWYLIQ